MKFKFDSRQKEKREKIAFNVTFLDDTRAADGFDEILKVTETIEAGSLEEAKKIAEERALKYSYTDEHASHSYTVESVEESKK